MRRKISKIINRVRTLTNVLIKHMAVVPVQHVSTQSHRSLANVKKEKFLTFERDTSIGIVFSDTVSVIPGTLHTQRDQNPGSFSVVRTTSSLCSFLLAYSKLHNTFRFPKVFTTDKFLLTDI